MDMIITLRKYELSDVDEFMKWACDAEVLQFSTLQAWVSPNSTREQVEKYFKQVVIPHPWFRAICLNGRPVGFVSIEPKSGKYETGRAVISGALSRHCWGKGLGTTATRMAVVAAFRELPHLLRIEACVDVDNYASQKGLENIGFLKEGLLRNYYKLS